MSNSSRNPYVQVMPEIIGGGKFFDPNLFNANPAVIFGAEEPTLPGGPQPGVVHPTTGSISADLLKTLGLEVDESMLDEQGRFGITDEDKKAARAAGMAALGAGLLQGLATASWAGITQGMTAGFQAAHKEAKSTLDEASERHMKSDAYAQARLQNAIKNRGDALALSSAEGAYQDEQNVRTHIEQALIPAVQDISSAIEDAEWDPNYSLDAWAARKASAHKSLSFLTAELLKGPRANLEFVMKHSEEIERLIPGVSEGLARKLGELGGIQAEAQMRGQLHAAKGSGLISEIEADAKAHGQRVGVQNNGMPDVESLSTRDQLRASLANRGTEDRLKASQLVGAATPGRVSDSVSRQIEEQREQMSTVAAAKAQEVYNLAGTLEQMTGMSGITVDDIMNYGEKGNKLSAFFAKHRSGSMSKATEEAQQAMLTALGVPPEVKQSDPESRDKAIKVQVAQLKQFYGSLGHSGSYKKLFSDEEAPKSLVDARFNNIRENLSFSVEAREVLRQYIDGEAGRSRRVRQDIADLRGAHAGQMYTERALTAFDPSSDVGIALDQVAQMIIEENPELIARYGEEFRTQLSKQLAWMLKGDYVGAGVTPPSYGPGY